MATRDLNQVVRLTRCLDVPGHTAKLVRVMTEAGYRWYPEYTVEEQFRDFNQSQYLCQDISILSWIHRASSLLLWTRGYY